MKKISIFLLLLSTAIYGQNPGRFESSTGGSGSAIESKDEGSSLTTGTTSFDFVGAGVTATNSGNAVTVTVPGGGSATFTVKDSTVSLSTVVNILDFLRGFSVTESPSGEVNVVVNDGEIDHDALLNFVANEHIDHSSVTFTAGDGLGGGGDISASRTFVVNVHPDSAVVISNDSLAVRPDDITINIANNKIQIKTGGVGTNQIANDGVTPDDLNDGSDTPLVGQTVHIDNASTGQLEYLTAAEHLSTVGAYSSSATDAAITAAFRSGTAQDSLNLNSGDIVYSPTFGTLNLATGGLVSLGPVLVPAEPYNATTWNGDAGAPQKNDVRDYLESGRTFLIAIGVDIPNLTSDTPAIGDSIGFWDITGNDFNRAALSQIEAILTLDNFAGTLSVTKGGTGRATGTTAYSLLATGTTATGAQQTLANGATTEILVGGGASALPVWTTATGSGAPVRATSPTLGGTPVFPATFTIGANNFIRSGAHALTLTTTATTNVTFPAGTSTLMNLGTAQSVTAGIKKSFQANATNAGFRLVGVTADPSAAAAGDMWYRSDTPALAYNDGSNRVVASRNWVSNTFTGSTNIVTLGTISTGTVPYANLSFSNNIVAGDLAANSVDTAELASGAITKAKMGHSVVRFAIDLPDSMGADTTVFWRNSYGTTVTVDSIYQVSDVDNFAVNYYKQGATGGSYTLVDAVTSTTNGTGKKFYITETTISSASVTAGQTLHFLKPTVNADRVYTEIYISW